MADLIDEVLDLSSIRAAYTEKHGYLALPADMTSAGGENPQALSLSTAYLLRALLTRNAAPTMTSKAIAMIQNGGEPAPAPFART
ncbi:hypothetical protein [Streptomyces sp. NPDC002746]